MQSSLVDLLERRRDRSIAAILSMKDRCDMSEDDGRRLRKVVLDQVNDLVETAIDLMRSVEDDRVTVNEYWLATQLREIREALLATA